MARESAYPSLTLSDGVVRSIAGCIAQEKSVQFEMAPCAFAMEVVCERVAAALAAGARVLAVLNTVARANTLLRSLEVFPGIDHALLFSCNGVICPHHGRFAPQDRALLDNSVRCLWGRNGKEGALFLAGTQTLEQSLDIDADFMISDLAPADVLLQRVGRLHRSERHRPHGYETPQCVLLVPPNGLDDALNERGEPTREFMRLGYGSVYPDLRTLELTRRLLTDRGVIRVPQDNRWLVEAVTNRQCLDSLNEEKWRIHGRSIEGGELAQAVSASYAVAVFDSYFGEFEFNESGGRVVTRLGANRLQLPLDQSITSPFGQRLREIVIPGHMAPGNQVDVVHVVRSDGESSLLQCGNRAYSYSRFGLEDSR
jgi:CRISPR-associated endonuclease/helicase Cas3